LAWKNFWAWEVVNVIWSSWQEEYMNSISSENYIYSNGYRLWYIENEIVHYVLPDFEIISTFPIPKFRTKTYRLIFKEISSYSPDIIVTRTRFFLLSLFAGLWAKLHGIQWAHIEHGSSYVTLSSRFKNLIARIYDQSIWRLVFVYADIVIPISGACQKFIEKFTSRKIEIIHRWMVFPDDLKPYRRENLQKKFKWKRIVWFVWRLYKRKNVSSLIQARYELHQNNAVEDIQLVIVWDWEDSDVIKELDVQNLIYFTGWVSFLESLAYQEQFDIHVHSSWPWWWLASTLLQGMGLWCTIVATPYEWANEVIVNGDNGILLQGSSVQDIKNGIIEAISLESEVIQSMRDKNYNIIINEFTRETVISKYKYIFQKNMSADWVEI
jgi:glycosyltransferase involved in cell wall biosynthesis